MSGLALYPRICGPAWAELDVTVRRLHESTGATRARGRFELACGRGLKRLLAFLVGLPRAGTGVEARLEIEPHARGETWRRRFGDEPLVTEQWQHASGLLVEWARGVELTFRLGVVDGALCFHQVGAALRVGPLRVPLPRWLAPRVSAREWPDGDGRVGVSVSVAVPILGRLYSYAGVLDALDP